MDSSQYINLRIEKLVSSKDKILIIYPHPDDEAFSCAGLIQRVLNIGAKVKVVILTKGEASTLKFGVNNVNDLSSVREQEFKNVMNLLNVIDYSIDSLPDKHLKENEIAVTNSVAEYINLFKPSIVITYEPCGVYGHPDHVLLSKVVTEINKSKDFKLIYSTVSKTYKPSPNMLAMADDPSKVKPLEANFILELSLLEFVNKLKAMSLYKSQFSTGKNNVEIKILIKALALKREYFFVNF